MSDPIREAPGMSEAGQSEKRFGQAQGAYQHADQRLDTLLNALDEPPWQLRALQIEARFLSNWSRAKSTLDSAPLDPNEAIEQSEAALKLMHELRPLLGEDNPVVIKWLESVSRTRDRANGKKQEVVSRAGLVEKTLSNGNYLKAGALVANFDDCFVHASIEEWRRATEAGQSLIKAVGAADQATIREERARNLDDALQAWTTLQDHRPSEDPAVEQYHKKVAALLADQARGCARLDRWEQAIDWWKKLNEHYPDHELMGKRDHWEEREKEHTSLMSQPGKDQADALRQAVESGFLFDDQHQSLHLALAIALSEDNPDEAAKAANTAAVELDDVLQDEQAWFAQSERDEIRAWGGDACTLDKEQVELGQKTRRNVLRYYLQKWWRGSKTEIVNCARLLSCLRALEEEGGWAVTDREENLPNRDAVVAQLLALAQDKLKREPAPDIENALACVGVARIFDSNQPTVRERGDEIQGRWLQHKRKELDLGILVHLQAQADKKEREWTQERLEQATNVLGQWSRLLDKTEAKRQSPDLWWVLLGHMREVQAWQGKLPPGHSDQDRSDNARQRAEQVLKQGVKSQYQRLMAELREWKRVVSGATHANARLLEDDYGSLHERAEVLCDLLELIEDVGLDDGEWPKMRRKLQSHWGVQTQKDLHLECVRLYTDNGRYRDALQSHAQFKSMAPLRKREETP